MTADLDPGRPLEDDPTGMRALLSALPDPGPMPPELVARITAALAAEQPLAPAAATTPEPTTTASADPTVVPLSSRRRPRRIPYAAAAAAAFVLLGGGLGGAWLLGGSSSSGTAGGSGAVVAAGSAQASAATSEAAAAADSALSAPQATPNRSDLAAGGGSAGSAGSAAAAAAGATVTIQIATGGTAYTTAHLADEVRALTAERQRVLGSLAAESPAIGPIGTPLGARACATALGVPATSPLLVDLAPVDGTSAAVLVATAPDGTRTAFAVTRTCPVGDFRLAGPLVL